MATSAATVKKDLAADEAHANYELLKEAQRRFGQVRIELGAILYRIKMRQLWRYYASSMTRFLEEERLNTNAASMWMDVAKVLIYTPGLSEAEFGLTEAQIEEISTVGMTTLAHACKIMTKDNVEDVIAMLSTLGERDAKQSLADLEQTVEPGERPKQNPRVKKLLSEYFSLPDECRLEFMSNLEARRRKAREASERGRAEEPALQA